MARARRVAAVELSPEAAYELWTDVARWPTFIDGFARAESVDPSWPQPGAKVVWQSVPTGRGRVQEKVEAAEPGRRFSTRVVEERMHGIQTAEFAPAPEGERGAAVALELEYTLGSRNPLTRLMDIVFIRRAQNDALARTLRRFAIEAAEQAAL